MRIDFSVEFDKKLKKIFKKDRILFEKIEKKIKIFGLDQSGNSLRLHKLTGKMREYWSISVDESIRIVFYYRNKDLAIFADVGKHEDVYK